MKDLTTRVIHHPYTPPAGFDAPQPAIHKASTVIFPNVAAMRLRDWKSREGYSYGLMGTPTTYLLEERLCELEGGSECMLVPSGLAAIAVVDAGLLKTGDEVLLPDNVYGPSKTLTENELTGWGIMHQFYDAMNPADLAAKIGSKTKLVWLEAPGSVTMDFPDLRALVRVCKERGVTTALDNTWGAGLAFRPFDLEPGTGVTPLAVDISVHALTKYPSGGGDVLMGSVMTRNHDLHIRLKAAHMHLGFGVAANDTELVLRSLPSMALRYRAHDVAARDLAQWCKGRGEFTQVLHPAIEGSPGHAQWRSLCGSGSGAQGGAAGLFSVMVNERFSGRQVDAFCDALKLFKIGYSWGGPVSLVVPYDLAFMRGAKRAAHLSSGTLVRFSIGLESVDDLREDMAQALVAMAAA